MNSMELALTDVSGQRKSTTRASITYVTFEFPIHMHITMIIQFCHVHE